MNFFKRFLLFFTAISTAILIICTIDIAVSDYETIQHDLTLKILGAAAVTAIITAAVFSREPESRKQHIIFSAVHYVLLCITMAFIGIAFEWISPNPFGVALMCLYVAAVYAIVFGISYMIMKKEADELNEAISKRRSNK